MKSILIISHSFHPMNSPRSFRTTELAKEFARQGHEITVLTPKKPEHYEFEKVHNLTIDDLGQPKWKIFNFKNLGKIGQFYNKAVNRLLPLLIEFPSIELFFKVKKTLRSEDEKFDLLISIAVPYPIHWGVAAVWSKKREKNVAPVWIADCGDPYFFQENDTLPKPFYFKWIEKWFMRKADFITVPTDTSFRGYFPDFHSKLRVIPQGFRIEDINKREVLTDGIVRFGYGGSLTLNRRDPSELLDFLTNLDKSIQFEFYVFTNNQNFIETFAKKDPRIILHAPVTRTKLLETLSSFNFVVNMANFGTAQTPSKLIDYAIIDKPILQIETGNLNKKTVFEFLEGNYSNSIKKIDLNSYRIENVVKEFLKLGADA